MKEMTNNTIISITLLKKYSSLRIGKQNYHLSERCRILGAGANRINDSRNHQLQLHRS